MFIFCVMYGYVLADVTSLDSCLNRSAILLDICFICTNLNDAFIRFLLQYLVKLLSKESICQHLSTLCLHAIKAHTLVLAKHDL